MKKQVKGLKKKKIWMIVIAVAVVAVITLIVVNRINKTTLNSSPESSELIYSSEYNEYLTGHGYTGCLTDEEIDVELTEYVTSGGLKTETGTEGILSEGSGSITWNFKVERTGFYNLRLGYIALPGTTSDIQRKLLIDDELHYGELSQIVIKRWWADEDITMKNNNEIRPGSYEIYSNTDWFVEDYNCRYGEPLIFFLDEGEHTITLETIKEPLEITGLTFMAAPKAESYETLIKTLEAEYRSYEGSILTFQAERKEGGTTAIIKSSSAINVQKNYTDSSIYPYHAYYRRYNTIGKESYENAGDSITWCVEVPAEGLYELTFKGRQSVKRGVTAYRRLYLNGEVPYAEMNAICFDYSNDMNNYTITDKEGIPYRFHLKEGTNTITLQVVMGPFGSVISEVEESLVELNRAYLSVIQLVGKAPSKFIDYQIALKEPEFAVIMKQESDRLYHLIDLLVELTGDKGEQTALLEKMARQAAVLAEDPEEVINELGQLKNNVAAVATWLVSISLMPLELDCIMASPIGAELPKATESFISGVWNSIARFVSTFFIDSNQVGETDEEENVSLKVWVVSYGKEQAQIIKNLSDDLFVPEQNIGVRVQLIPADVVLRAALAGSGPDVVLGLAQGTAQDFAMRGASVDISKQAGYEEIASRFIDSTINAASYKDGVYGFAEQANFMMMFYRTDIFEKLELEAPLTWQAFVECLPVLQQNNYGAFVPNSYLNDGSGNLNFYPSLVLQYGGDVYKGEGDDYGYESALDSNAAMEAFKDYTDLFTNYGLEKQIDFANRFRTGETPLGIVNYTTFNTLEVFAPEIKGLWALAPIPGVEQADGTIANTVIIDTVQSIIMSSTEKPEAAWSFLKWWASEEVQLQFATQTEAIMGTAQRYPTANPYVLEQLPWSYDELEALQAQLSHTVGLPAVPGYYMTGRMISYAYSEVVTETSNPRESLYLNIKTVNKELTAKRESFAAIKR